MASQASRRFHEAGVGSRTGLRLSAVARDQDGFEDLEAFYKASQAALDHQKQQHPDELEDDDEDYDSFDEATFNRRRQAASSSSMMDIQNSSAPSPRSLLRSSRGSAAVASVSSPERAGQAHGNITLADDDDQLDLPELSTGSRSFNLVTMASNDANDDEEPEQRLRAPSTPQRGLSERKAGTLPNAKRKGKEPVTARRNIQLSDSDDDDILASIQQRLESAYDDEQDQWPMSEDEIVPVKPSPAKMTTAAASSHTKPRKRSRMTKGTADERPAVSAPSGASSKRPKKAKEPTNESSVVTAPPAASSKNKPERPPKSRAVEKEPEPEPELAFGLDEDEPEPAHFAARSSSISTPPPAAKQLPKRKRGEPAKKSSAEQPAAASRVPQKASTTSTGVGRPAASSEKHKATKPKKVADEVVERVRLQPREATVINENGVRRSTRQRFAPLEYWRGERIRYGRPSLPSGTTPDDLCGSQGRGEDEFEEDPSMMLVRRRVPVLDIKEVIRVPRAPGEGTFSGTTMRARSTTRRKVERKSEERAPRLTPQTRVPEDEDEYARLDPTADTIYVEDGWDEETVETGMVIKDEASAEVEVSVVRTKATHRPIPVANQRFRFEKFFNSGGVMATGILHLPPGASKPTKSAKDNSFVFCVLQGALRASVHRKSFIIGPKGVFQVPAGNTYSLENICQREVHLFFAQCIKTKIANAGDLTMFTQMSDTSYGTPGFKAGLYSHDQRGGRDDQRLEDEMRKTTESAAGESMQLQQQRGNGKVLDHRPVLTARSDADDSDEDDFELSRRVKSAKRVFRKL